MVRRREQTGADGGTSAGTPAARPRRTSLRGAAAATADTSSAEVDPPPPLASPAVSGTADDPPPAASPAGKRTPARGAAPTPPGPRARRSARLSLPEEPPADAGAGDGVQETQAADGAADSQQKATLEAQKTAGDDGLFKSPTVRLMRTPIGKGRQQKAVVTPDAQNKKPDTPTAVSKSSESPQKPSVGESRPASAKGNGDGAEKAVKEVSKDSSSTAGEKSGDNARVKNSRKSADELRPKEQRESKDRSSQKDGRKSFENSLQSVDHAAGDGLGPSDRQKERGVRPQERREPTGASQRKAGPDSKEKSLSKSSSESRDQQKGSGDSSRDVKVEARSRREEESRKDVLNPGKELNKPKDVPPREERASAKDERERKATSDAPKDESKSKDPQESKDISKPKDRESSRDTSQLKEESSKHSSSHKDGRESSKDDTRHKDRRESSQDSSKHKDRTESSKDSSRHKSREESSKDTSERRDREQSSKDGSSKREGGESSKDSSRHKDGSKSSSELKDRGESSRDKDRDKSSRDSSKHRDRHGSSKDSSRHRHRDSSKDRSKHRDRHKSSKDRRESKDKDRHESSKDKHESSKDKHESSKDKHESSKERHESKDRRESSKDGHESSKDKHESSKDRRESSKDKHESSKDRRESSKERHRHKDRRDSSRHSSSSHKHRHRDDRHRSSKSSSDRKHRRSSSRDRSSRDHRRDSSKGGSEKERQDSSKLVSDKTDERSSKDNSGDARLGEISKDDAQGKVPLESSGGQSGQETPKEAAAQRVTFSEETNDKKRLDSSKHDAGAANTDVTSQETSQHGDGAKMADGVENQSEQTSKKSSNVTVDDTPAEKRVRASLRRPGPSGDGVAAAAAESPEVTSPATRRVSSRRCVLAVSTGPAQKRGGATQRRVSGRTMPARATRASAARPPPEEDSCDADGPFAGFDAASVDKDATPVLHQFLRQVDLLVATAGLSVSDGIVKVTRAPETEQSSGKGEPTPKRTRRDVKTEKVERSSPRTRATRQSSGGASRTAEPPGDTTGDDSRTRETRSGRGRNKETTNTPDKNQRVAEDRAPDSSQTRQSFPPAVTDRDSLPAVDKPSQEQSTPSRSSRSRSKAALAQPSPSAAAQSKTPVLEVRETRRSTRGQSHPLSITVSEQPEAQEAGASRSPAAAGENRASPSPLRSASEASSLAASADSRSPLIGVPPPDADDNACSFPSMPFRGSGANDHDDSGCVSSAAPAAAGVERDSPTRSDGYSGGDEISAGPSRRQRTVRRAVRRRAAACQPPEPANASSSSTVGTTRLRGRAEKPQTESDERVSFSFEANRLSTASAGKDSEYRSPKFSLRVGQPAPSVSSREASAAEYLAIPGPSGAADEGDMLSSDDEDGPFLGWTPVSSGLRPVSEKPPQDRAEQEGAAGESVDVADGASASFDPRAFVDVTGMSEERESEAPLMADSEQHETPALKTTEDDVPADSTPAPVAAAAKDDVGDSVSESLPAEKGEDAVDKSAKPQAAENVDDEDASMPEEPVAEGGLDDEPSSDGSIREDRDAMKDAASRDRIDSDDAPEPFLRERSPVMPSSESERPVFANSAEGAASNKPVPKSDAEDMQSDSNRPAFACELNSRNVQETWEMAIDLASIPLPDEMPKNEPVKSATKPEKERPAIASLELVSENLRGRESDEVNITSDKSHDLKSRPERRRSDLNDNLEKESSRELVAEPADREPSDRKSDEQPEKETGDRPDSEHRERRFESVQYDSDSDSEHRRAVSAAVEAELESDSQHQDDSVVRSESVRSESVGAREEHVEKEAPPKSSTTGEDSNDHPLERDAEDEVTERTDRNKISRSDSVYDPEHPTATTDESQESHTLRAAESRAESPERSSPRSVYDPSQSTLDCDSVQAGTLLEPPSPVTGDPSLNSPPPPAGADDDRAVDVPSPPPGQKRTAESAEPSQDVRGVTGERTEGERLESAATEAEPKSPSVKHETADGAKAEMDKPASTTEEFAEKKVTAEPSDRSEPPSEFSKEETDEKKPKSSTADPETGDAKEPEKTSGDPSTAADVPKPESKDSPLAAHDSAPMDDVPEKPPADDGPSPELAQHTDSGVGASPAVPPPASDSPGDSRSPAPAKAEGARGDQRSAAENASASAAAAAAAANKRPGYVTSPERKKSAAETGMSTLAKVLNQKFANSRIHATKIGEKLRNYQVITDNIWLAPKPRETKQQKETRRMVCDCSLGAEELERGERGCGPDCLNRLLMIECGSRCPMGERCGNKRFTRRRYCRTEVFRTDLKGYGLRALQDLPAGAFIYEYVGEVLDMREFRRRRKLYDRLKYNHQYFMALRGDTIVDATEKGNDSRFINHSCEPNSETQKWTVNGELRIGFFTQRPVAAGEEITFDYQLRRYGRKAQRCFCGSEQCRGWIGRKPDDQTPESDDDDDAEEDDAAAARAGPQRKLDRARITRRDAARRELSAEISRLATSGLKSRQHTLELSRLMVRAEVDADRCTLLQLLRAADQPCRRLFLDYHGLRLIWTWMACGPTAAGDSPTEASDTYTLRKEILKTLSVLPIPDRTALRETRVLAAVERWARTSRPSTPPTPDTDPPSDHTPPEGEQKLMADTQAAEISELASALLTSWCTLQNVFRIPKKERLQRMREHEQEADRGYQTYLEQQTRASSQYAKRGYDCSPERRKRSRESPEPAERRAKKYRAFSDSRLTKEERRKLFVLEVQQEEEQERRRRQEQERERRRLQGGASTPAPTPAPARAASAETEPEREPEPERAQREQQEELWSGHEQRCSMLGLDPYLTPIFDASFQYYWEPSAGAWQPYTPGDPAVPLVAAAGSDPALMAALPHHLAVFQSMAAVDLQQAQQYLSRVAQGRQPATATPAGASAAARAPLAPSPHRPPSPPLQQRPPSPPHPRPPSPQQPPPLPAGRPPSPPPQELPTRVLADQLPQMGLMDLLRAQVTGRFEPDPSLAASAAGPAPADSVASIPLPEETSAARPRSPPPQQPPLPREPGRPPPPPEPEAEPSVRLPPKWRMTTDDTGRVYYYHQVTLEARWEPPAYPDSTVADPLPTGSPSYSPTSESGSSSSSESSDSSSTDSESGSESESSTGSAAPAAAAPRRRRVSPAASDGSQGEKESRVRQQRPQPRTPSPVLPEAPPPPRLTAPEDELEEGEIPDVSAAERALRRLSRKRSRAARLDPLRERPPSPPPESSRSEARRERRQRRADARRERRRDRECERLLRKHRRHLQESTVGGGRSAGDDARHIREEAIRRFKEKEEALLQQQEQAIRERRRAEAEAENAAKRRKLDPKRSSSSSSGTLGSASSATARVKPTSAAADTSSTDTAKKKDMSADPVLQIKDRFLVHMSAVVVSVLNAYRKPTCKQGRITSTDDFKLLAKKLTHHVLVKELRSVRRVEELVPSEPVKHKARCYVRKYMSRFGELYTGGGPGGGDEPPPPGPPEPPASDPPAADL